MNLELEGKRALVTGSTAGIGFAAARALAREGAIVTVNGRTQQRVDKVFAAVLLASVLGLALFGMINAISYVTLRRWHASEQGES